MMYYMGHTYHTYDVHCPYHKNDVRFPDPLSHDLYLTDLDANLSRSPGPGQAKPEPSPGWWLWPGLGFSKAKATSGQAKARASRPKPGQNITKEDKEDDNEMPKRNWDLDDKDTVLLHSCRHKGQMFWQDGYLGWL